MAAILIGISVWAIACLGLVAIIHGGTRGDEVISRSLHR